MTKIKQINFKDYRAFLGNKNKLELDGGNALIYGENGSGKSSLYLGLKDFFCAFDATGTIEELPSHLKAGNRNDYEVKVIFSSPKKSLIFKGETVEDEVIGQTFLLNSFLSYKEMLKTHFLNKNELFEDKFYELLTETLLVNYEIGDTTIGKSVKDLQDKLSEPSNKEELLRKIREIRPDADEEDLDEIDTKAEIEKGKVIFDETLEGIVTPLNEILDYFKQGIKVKFKKLQLTFDEKEKKLKGSLGLDINYIGIDDIEHLKILNEARLSALAISIYLAAIVTNPVVRKAKYKILFLDDVFIGLDTSNRLPLLDILQNYTVKEIVFDKNGNVVEEVENKIFKDFQILITTYDRYWFEVAKRRLELQTNWNFFEMYAVKKVTSGGKFVCDVPTIKPNGDNIANALKHINNPIYPDYPAAANYLRKANEETLRSNLPERELKEDSGLTPSPLMLKGLLESAISFVERLHFDPSLLREMKKEHLKTLLNPLSHFEIESPIYKGELERILELTQKIEIFLRNLKKKYRLILPRESLVQFNFDLVDISATEKGFYNMKIKEDLYLSKTASGNKISNVKFHVVQSFTTSVPDRSNVPNAKEDWISIEDGYQKSFDFVINNGHPSLKKAVDYIAVTEYEDNAGNWQPISTLTTI